MAAAPESVLANIAKHLDATNSDASDVAMACATLAIVLRQSSQAPEIDGACDKLCTLLTSEDDTIKANAMAALSAGLEVSDEYANKAVQSRAAKELVQLLSASDRPPTPRVALNALGVLGALGEASESGLDSIVSAGGLGVVLTFCTPQQDPVLLESAVGTVCKLMSSGPSAKTAAIEAGLIPAMASLIPAGVATDDVTVRCLLALGMVIDGDDNGCRVQLASTQGAVQSLLALMRREDDADCQQISAGIFSELSKSPAAKEAVTTAIKNIQKAN